MKNMLIIVLTAVVSLPVFANTKWKIQKLNSVGYLKNAVIFQSRDLKFVKSKNLYKGKIISQWGLHVFEVSSAFYNCDSKKLNVRYCRFIDYEPIATYEKCQITGSKAVCQKQIKAKGGSSQESDSHYRSDDLVDSVKDDMHRDKTDEWDEYPPRDPDNVDNVVIGF
jgi:hypothetical protein